MSCRLVAIMGISSTIGRLLIGQLKRCASSSSDLRLAGRAASFLSQMKLLQVMRVEGRRMLRRSCQASMAITGLAVASLAFLPKQEATLVKMHPHPLLQQP